MKRGAIVVVVLLVAFVGWWGSQAPRAWSVVLLVAEPPAGALLPGANPAGTTPRLSRLAGAGVRLPLRAPDAPVEEWLSQVLGGGGPEDGLLAVWEERSWDAVLASTVPVSDGFAGSFTKAVVDERSDVAESAFAVLEKARVRRGAPTLMVVVARPGTREGWDATVARTIDGVAPRLTLARTLVVVADRADRSALLVAPVRPDSLDVKGALGPKELGAEVGRWLRLGD